MTQPQLFPEVIRCVSDKSVLPLPWSKWTSPICVCLHCAAIHPRWTFGKGQTAIHGEECPAQDWVIFSNKQ